MRKPPRHLVASWGWWCDQPGHSSSNFSGLKVGIHFNLRIPPPKYFKLLVLSTRKPNMKEYAGLGRSLRAKRKTYIDGMSSSDEESENLERTLDPEDIIKSKTYPGYFVKEMVGEDVTLEHFQRTGFKNPIIVKEKAGLHIKNVILLYIPVFVVLIWQCCRKESEKLYINLDRHSFGLQS
jgi:hypothetical protein